MVEFTVQKFLERRTSARIATNLKTSFFLDNSFYSGVLMNLSENGMFISTMMSFPFNSNFEVLIPFREDVLKVNVKVSRIVKTDDLYHGMGVEVLNPSKNYLEFIRSLQPRF